MMPAAIERGGDAHRVVVVTGGAGQLGTLLLRRLFDLPEVERVICIDRRPPFVDSPKLSAVIADVRDPAIAQHLYGADALLHCAFIINGHERTPLYRAVNVEGSKRVFAAALAAGVRTIVYVSSITAYGCVPDHPVPIREDTPRVLQPDFPYAACKYELEAHLDEVEPQHPEVAISRIRANILIGRKMQHLIGRVMRLGLIPDPGGTPLPIVWDEDVADLMLLAMRCRARGAFNAAAEALLPSPELAERTGCRAIGVSPLLLKAYIGLHAVVTRLGLQALEHPSWVTQTRGCRLIASSARARAEPGWSPRYPTAVAVVQHFRAVGPRVSDLRLLAVLWLMGRLARRMLPADPREPVRLSLYLDGPVGGDFSFVLERRRLTVRPWALPVPCGTLAMEAGLFRDVLAGRADPDAARAEGRIDFRGRPSEWAAFRDIAALLTQARADGGRSLSARTMLRCL